MACKPTIAALHEVIQDEPMALVMGPAIQAGFSLAARLNRDYPEIWQQMQGELLEVTASVEGVSAAETEVIKRLVGILEKQHSRS